jgi:hypothetical protein
VRILKDLRPEEGARATKKAAVACRGTRIYLERTIIDSIADVKGKNGKNGID